VERNLKSVMGSNNTEKLFKILLIDIIPAVTVITFLSVELVNSPAKYLGLLIASVSLALWLKTLNDLGDSFATLPKAKKLVTHGFYKKTRHPLYFLGLLVFLGLAIAVNHPLAYFLVLLMAILQLFRSKREEQVLQKKFGDKYLIYKKQVKF